VTDSCAGEGFVAWGADKRASAANQEKLSMLEMLGRALEGQVSLAGAQRNGSAINL